MSRTKIPLLISLALLLICVIALLAFSFGILTPKSYTVTFQDYDGKVLKTDIVRFGKSATAPESPTREGYTFAGWNKNFDSVTEDMVITAEYTRIAETSFVVDTVTISPDTRRAEIKVSITNNPGILGMVLSVNYDDDALQLVGCKNGISLSALAFQEPSRLLSGCNFVWYGSKLGEIVDGEILVLTFEIANDAKAGTYPISISWNDNSIYDSNSDMVNPSIVQGGIILN